MANADRLLARLAERQHGVVSRRQLLAAGIGRRAIGSRLDRGSLLLIHRGIYAVGHAPRSTEGRWMAAVLAVGPRALLSHRSAARLWRLIPPSAAAVEVTRPRSCRSRSEITVHRSEIPDDERTVLDGIPVTTVPRTILDLAAVASRREVERAFNEVEVRQLTDPLSIPDLLDRYPRRHGTARLRGILDDAERAKGITRNDFEERFVRFVDLYGLPRPRFNADVAVAGRFFIESDRERDRLLLAGGWRVVRVTWHQLRNEEMAIAADLRTLLRPLRKEPVAPTL